MPKLENKCSSGFEKGELFSPSQDPVVESAEQFDSLELDTSKGRKLCPRCGLPGTGPYERYVLNGQKKKFEPYSYFKHRNGKSIKWCYLGKANKPKVSNCEEKEVEAP